MATVSRPLLPAEAWGRRYMPAAGRAVPTTSRDFPRSVARLSCTPWAGRLAWDPAESHKMLACDRCSRSCHSSSPGERLLRVISPCAMSASSAWGAVGPWPGRGPLLMGCNSPAGRPCSFPRFSLPHLTPGFNPEPGFLPPQPQPPEHLPVLAPILPRLPPFLSPPLPSPASCLPPPQLVTPSPA